MESSCTRRTRLVRAALGAALVGGALVGVTTSAAQAAVAGTAVYDCTTPLGSTVPVPVTVAADALPTTAPAGLDVPAGAFPVDLSVLIPAAFGDTLGFLGVTGVGGSSNDLGFGLGDATVPLRGVTVPSTPVVTGQDTVLSVPTSTGAFTTPDAGTYPITMPDAFTFDALSQLGLPLGTLECALAAGQDATIGSLETTKQASTTRARAVKAKVPAGKKPVISVTVVPETGGTPDGTVVVTKGTKTLGTGTLGDTGKARIALPKMKPGRYKVAVQYAGDGATEASATTASFTVVR